MLKKFFVVVLSSFLFVCFAPIKVIAEEKVTNEPTIDPEQVTNIEVIDGEVYIDVLEPYSSPYDIFLRSSVGKCPETYSYTYAYMTKEELIAKKQQCDNGSLLASALVGFLVGLANPILGAVAGGIAGASSMFSQAAQNALYYNNKANDTVRSTFRCEDSYQGSRGWVHRYKLIEINIY